MNGLDEREREIQREREREQYGSLSSFRNRNNLIIEIFFKYIVAMKLLNSIFIILL